MGRSIDDMLAEYAEKRDVYSRFGACVCDLLGTLLASLPLTIHSIAHRAKAASSLRQKLARPGKEYNALTDCTDLAGVRIITYLVEDVDRVGAVIEREFRVDKNKSVDKREVQEVDRFGYSSLHKVCSLSRSREQLGEYLSFRGLQCEIQVRSILQHAWAEIEHDLGYKSAVGVPQPVRRRFSQVAALLEMADDEFTRLKGDLDRYAQEMETTARDRPQAVPVDSVTLDQFVSHDAGYADLVALLARQGASIHADNKAFIETRVGELKYVGVETIDDLRKAVVRNKAAVGRLHLHAPGLSGPLSRAWGIFAIAQLIVARRATLDDIVRGLGDMKILDESSRTAHAALLRSVLRTRGPRLPARHRRPRART